MASMAMEQNSSNTLMFTLTGINNLRPKYLYVLLFLVIYLLILILNLTLIVTILLDKSLHEPMYLFLCNLCLNGLYGTAGFYPKFLYDLLAPQQVISFIGCNAQSYVIYTSFMCEYTTLVIMAYDRYVAICHPLEYHNMIVTQTVIKAVLYSWAFPLLATFPCAILTNQLPLCGSEIDRFYCYNWAMVRMSCIPATAVNIYGLVLIGIFAAHAVFVVISYQRLIVACRRSSDSKKKFMQTCVPHLVSLVNFTITLLFDTMFTRYGTENAPAALRYFLQVEVLMVPPVLNPLMYGLKLSEVRKRIFRKYKRKINIK